MLAISKQSTHIYIHTNIRTKKHTCLYPYVPTIYRSKGADDTVVNLGGLTCYEGLSEGHVAGI